MHDGLWDAVYEERGTAGGADDRGVDAVGIAEAFEGGVPSATDATASGAAFEYDCAEAGGVDLVDDGDVEERGWG